MVDKIKNIETKLIVNPKQLKFILQRLAHQLIENHLDFNNTALIGVQPRGIELCKIIHKIIETKLNTKIPLGFIDISLYRDDLHINTKPQALDKLDIPFSIEGKKIILIDDVLYTGRTIRAALDALMDFGRPIDIELLVLIDRKLHRNVPIQAKYIGKIIDSIEKEKVKVFLNISKETDRVEIFTPIHSIKP